MTYNKVFTQWNSLIPSVQNLQENINACIDEKGYTSEKELDDLKVMRRGCYELFRILLGYFD